MKGDASNNDSPITQQTPVSHYTVSPLLIARLQPPYQRLVHLHYIDRQSYAKIAKQLQLPLGTVKSYISRALKRLQASHPSDSSTGWRSKSAGEYHMEGGGLDLLMAILPEPYCTVIRLHYQEKLSYTEIAQQLQLPEGTVKSQIHRGKKWLHTRCGET